MKEYGEKKRTQIVLSVPVVEKIDEFAYLHRINRSSAISLLASAGLVVYKNAGLSSVDSKEGDKNGGVE